MKKKPGDRYSGKPLLSVKKDSMLDSSRNQNGDPSSSSEARNHKKRRVLPGLKEQQESLKKSK